MDLKELFKLSEGEPFHGSTPPFSVNSALEVIVALLKAMPLFTLAFVFAQGE